MQSCSVNPGKTMKLNHSAIAAACAAFVSLPAAADTVFDFYKLGRGAGDFVSSDGIACTGADRCSSNVDAGVRNGDLTFQSGGITAVATGTSGGQTAAVVQDSDGGWTSSAGAGLGVYHLTGDSSDDNITSGEVLTLTFDRIVRLTSIALRADGHNYTAWDPRATFLFNGVSMLLPDDVGSISLHGVFGQTFTFAFGGGAFADQFYLASASVLPGREEITVPEPGGLALLATALGALGWASRRRDAAKPAQRA